jgi:transcription initiation factor TFIIIB Brf1 subunit/transcription initiation factor TFIIB
MSCPHCDGMVFMDKSEPNHWVCLACGVARFDNGYESCQKNHAPDKPDEWKHVSTGVLIVKNERLE